LQESWLELNLSNGDKGDRVTERPFLKSAHYQ
jgi:hypothetical protein